MMKGFRIDRNDGRIYAMGVTAVSGGVHFSFPSKGETCAVILYRKGAKSPKGRIEFPVNARTGDVWSMTVLGDFSGLEYISSAGLRVLLYASKTMKGRNGKLVIRNAGKDVMEVFVITGFADRLTIEN